MSASASASPSPSPLGVKPRLEIHKNIYEEALAFYKEVFQATEVALVPGKRYELLFNGEAVQIEVVTKSAVDMRLSQKHRERGEEDEFNNVYTSHIPINGIGINFAMKAPQAIDIIKRARCNGKVKNSYCYTDETSHKLTRNQLIGHFTDPFGFRWEFNTPHRLEYPTQG